MENPLTVTLDQLAALPLDRIVVSACCATEGDGLGPVGGIKEKFAAAKAEFTGDRALAAFGVATKQEGLPDDPTRIVRGETLGKLLDKLCSVLPQLFGPTLELPPGLEGAAGAHYDARRFQPFPWLNAKIAQALGDDAQREQPGGYLFIEGGPARGKTSWALGWQRASAGLASMPSASESANPLPSLTAWFFARRYGVGNGFGNPYLREENALQTLISMARLRRNAVPPAQSRLLLSELDHSYDYRNIDDQAKLGSAFQQALTHLAASEPRPCAEQPLILLLDSADELWSQGEGTFQRRTVFPELLFPKQLPPYTYVVILSRPGGHLAGQDNLPLVLHYQFTPEDVEAAIHHYLDVIALEEANRFDFDEQAILRDPDFQRQIAKASEGAFGYVTRLMEALIKPSNTQTLGVPSRLTQLRRWRDVPGSLPQGVYEQRARELVGLCQALEEQQSGQARRLTRALAGLALTQSQPPLTAAGLADLVAEPVETRPEIVLPMPSASQAMATLTPPVAPMDLTALATLPLDRVVISGCCSALPNNDAIGPAKASRFESLATPIPQDILALGGAIHAEGLPDHCAVVAATTLSALAEGLNGLLAPQVFGPLLEPPFTLLDTPRAAANRAGHDEIFANLNQAVAQALSTAPSGYLFIEGEAGSGKTCWALDWRRHSAQCDPLDSLTTHSLPPLSAWFFAGHDHNDVGTPRSDPAYSNEVNALQTLVAMARRQRGVPARTNPVHLLSPATAADYDTQNREQQTCLREAFLSSLYELATARHALPTTKNPLILLLDGADRLFGGAEDVSPPRIGFPWIFPDTLPDHIYLVVVSRPGRHLWLGQRDITPLLRYRFVAAPLANTTPVTPTQPPTANPRTVEYPKTSDGELQSCIWQERKQVRKALNEAHPFFMGPPPGQTLAFLQFDHSLTAELALAKQQVEASVDLFTATGDTIKHWHLIACCAQEKVDKEAESTADWPTGIYRLSDAERQAANAQLHRTIGERSARYWPALDSVRPATKAAIEKWQHQRRYAILWGLHHALQGAAGLTKQATSPIVAKALSFLLHAGYLQTAIRVGGKGSLDALRETYIAADQVPNAQEDQNLRHRIESHLLHWHPHLVANRLQVGALLWNLLGGWLLAKNQIDRWKASLDTLALLVRDPLRPMDLVKHLNGYQSYAVSSCKQWLVTSGSAGTAVWDLRQGIHRSFYSALIPYEFTNLCCQRKEGHLYIFGYKEKYFTACSVSLKSGQIKNSHYFLNSKDENNCISMQIDKLGFIAATGGLDGIIGVLSLNWDEIEENNHPLKHEEVNKIKLSGYIARYSGHEAPVRSISLYARDQELIITSGSDDHSIGILFLRREQVSYHSKTKVALPGYLNRYTGYHGPIHQCLLYVHDRRLLVVSRGADTTIGVLYLNEEELSYAWKHPTGGSKIFLNRLLHYPGHQKSIVGLAAFLDTRGLVVASASRDCTVGLLVLDWDKIFTHSQEQSSLKRHHFSGNVVLYTGHQGWVTAIALYGDKKRIIAVSGSEDETIGLLSIRRDEKYNCIKKSGSFEVETSTENLIRYSGHQAQINTISLHLDTQGLIVVSGSDDKKVGVLCLDYQELSTDRDHSDNKVPLSGYLFLYTGHGSPVWAVGLYTEKSQLIILSKSWNTFGALSLNREKICKNMKFSANKTPLLGKLIQFSGHQEPLESVSLFIDKEGLIVVSGGQDCTVGVLCINREEFCDLIIKNTPTSMFLTHYKGHSGWILTTALRVHALKELVIATGSQDKTIGVLYLDRDKLYSYTRQSLNSESLDGYLRRYITNNWVWSVDLHIDGQKIIVISGNEDRTLDILSLERETIISNNKLLSNNPLNGSLIRYSGHKRPVAATTLYAETGKLIVASASMDDMISLFCLGLDQIDLHLREQVSNGKQPLSGYLPDNFKYKGYPWSIELDIDSRGEIKVISSNSEGVITVITKQQNKSTSVPKLSEDHSLIGHTNIKWRKNPQFNSVNHFSDSFWGLNRTEIINTYIDIIDTNQFPKLKINIICPYYAEDFNPFDIAFLDQTTIVIAGACSNDVALMLLEYTQPT